MPSILSASTKRSSPFFAESISLLLIPPFPTSIKTNSISSKKTQQMLQNQLDDFWSDSIPLLLVSHLAGTLHRFRSLLFTLLRFLRILDPRGFPDPTTSEFDASFLNSIGSGLAGLIVLADKLESNRALSLRFEAGRDGEFGHECAVCMSELREGEEVRVLGCRHVYHKGCLDQCLCHQVFSCPLCKRPMVAEAASGTGLGCGDQLATAARVGEGLLASFAPAVM